MTLVHVDTSFLIKALVSKSREDGLLRNWLRESANIAISVIAWAEFLCGPVTDGDQQLARRIVGSAVALVEDDAVQAAKLFNAGGRRRGTFADCLIAAAALRAGAMLATSNPTDFRRFEKAGLVLASR
jgi:predicted nucleic acid-binding protein